MSHIVNLQNPDGDVRLAALDSTALPDLVDGSIRTDGVGDIVGTVSERGGTSGHDLHKGVQVFGAVVVVRDVGVDLVEVAGQDALLLLHVDDVLVNTLEEDKLEVPEDHGARVPRTLRLGTNDAALLLDLDGLGDGLGGILRDLLALVAGLLLGTHKLVAALTAGTSKILKLLAGKVTLIEILDTSLGTLGLSRGVGALEQERAHGDVPPAELPVVDDDDTVEPGQEEDGDDQSPGGTDTNDQASSLAISEGNGDGTTLPHDKHGKKGGSDTEVDGSEEETLPDGLASKHDSILGDEEDDGTKGTSQTGRDDPSEEDRHDTRADALVELGPVNTIGANQSDTHANNTAHDGVSSRDGKTNASTEGEVDGRGDNGAHHAKHEEGGIILELVNVDDLCSDGISDSGTDTDGSCEFEDGSQGHSLEVGDGSG